MNRFNKHQTTVTRDLHKFRLCCRLLCQVCSDAQAESDMEKTFLKLQQGWRARFFQVDKFACPVWQHRVLQKGLTETGKLTEGSISNVQTANQRSSKDSGFFVIGETSYCKPAYCILILLSY